MLRRFLSTNASGGVMSVIPAAEETLAMIRRDVRRWHGAYIGDCSALPKSRSLSSTGDPRIMFGHVCEVSRRSAIAIPTRFWSWTTTRQTDAARCSKNNFRMSATSTARRIWASRGANNLAAAESRGRYILFLNPDTEICEGAIRTLSAALDAHPEAGMVGARLLNTDRTLQTTCVTAIPNILNQTLNLRWLRVAFPMWSIWGMRALYQRQQITDFGSGDLGRLHDGATRGSGAGRRIYN